MALVICLLIGGGTPLFAHLDKAITLRRKDVQPTTAATHLRFTVVNQNA